MLCASANSSCAPSYAGVSNGQPAADLLSGDFVAVSPAFVMVSRNGGVGLSARLYRSSVV